MTSKSVLVCLKEQRLAIVEALAELKIARAKLMYGKHPNHQLREHLDNACLALRDHDTQDLEKLGHLAEARETNLDLMGAKLDPEFAADFIKQILVLQQQDTENAKQELAWHYKTLAIFIGCAINVEQVYSKLAKEQQKIVTGFIRETIRTNPELKEFAEELTYGRLDSGDHSHH